MKNTDLNDEIRWIYKSLSVKNLYGLYCIQTFNLLNNIIRCYIISINCIENREIIKTFKPESP